MGTSFIENLPKSCFLSAFLPTKLLVTSTRFIASVLRKYPESYKVCQNSNISTAKLISDLFCLILVNV